MESRELKAESRAASVSARVVRRGLRVGVLTALAAVAGAVSACSGDSPVDPNGGPDTTTTTPPRAITVTFAGGVSRAELATTGAQRSAGLSNRTSIAADSGMLFVFGTERTPTGCGFWMQDTHFDLDIAFMGTDKRVINIAAMTKETTTVHSPTANCKYALEMPKGWFAAHGVVAGSTATFTIPAGVIIDP
jgi:uncharacterized membrane protein (UPF0127 family)